MGKKNNLLCLNDILIPLEIQKEAYYLKALQYKY